MTSQEASRVVGFLATAKPNTDTMKGHIVNSINALLMSPDPVSSRFCQMLTESMNRSASQVLNESANPALPPQALQPFGRPQSQPQPQQQQQNTPEAILEAINDRAAMLMI